MNDFDRMVLASDGGGSEGAGNARLLRSLWRGKWLVLCLTLLGAAVGWEYLHGVSPFWDGLTPRYRATARLIVSNREVDPMRGEGTAGVKQTALLNQQRALLKSEAILKPLSEDPALQDLKHFRGIQKPLISALNDGLFAGIDAKSDLVLIHFESPFKRDAVQIVDSAVERFLEYHRTRKLEDTRELIQLLNEELDGKITEREALEAQVFELKRKNLALFGAGGGTNLATDRLGSASQALTQASQKVVEARSKSEAMQEARAESRERFLRYGEFYRLQSPSSILENRIGGFISARTNLENELERKRDLLTEDHKTIVDLVARIEALKERENEIVLEYAEAYLRSTEIALHEAEREEKHWRGAYLSLEDEVLRTEEAANGLKLLEGKRAIVQEELDQLLSRIGELNLAESTGALNIHVMEKARASTTPVYPDPIQIMGFAVAIGLALGLGIVFLRGFLDRRIFTVEEVPDLMETSVLAVFPRLAGSKRSRIGRVVHEEQGSLAAEAIRSVRTAVTFGLPDNGKGVVLITSSVAGEGKSVTASNLALALAQAGRKTVLVDADLRSPGQNEIYNVAGKTGMGDVLSGGTSTKKSILRGVAKNLDLMPAGDSHGRAAELIDNDNCKELIDWLRRQYDCVIIDSSPVLETAETRVLASLSDVTIFVLRMDRSSAPDALRARDILKGVHARILGVLLNGTKPKRGARSYAGGIAYGGYGDTGGRGDGGASRVA